MCTIVAQANVDSSDVKDRLNRVKVAKHRESGSLIHCREFIRLMPPSLDDQALHFQLLLMHRGSSCTRKACYFVRFRLNWGQDARQG